ncbi:RrF2 family transcriptional regulator [Paenibacillus sp. y28]|uniref:RrF2 family transcriptional regulator n=1 Tax=Paenibacillus sp. y28 TaxID=3129110 RepID=UPI00301ABA87
MNSEFVIAVHSLVLLAHVPGNMMTSEQISSSISVHPVRVRKVLSLLRKKGYIVSKEGIGGGFILACEPQQVCLDELYWLTSSGSIKPKWPSCNKDCVIGAHIEETMDCIIGEGERQLTGYFNTFTIADILERTKRKAADETRGELRQQ